MLKRASSLNGLPPRLYRGADEIKRDVSEILAKSLRVRELLSVRELMSSAMDEITAGRMDALYNVCEELLHAVSEAKNEMEALDRELDELKIEIISVF